MPPSKDPLLRLLAKHHRLDEWERYTGPQGGEGWINTITGEKVYQEDKPGSDDGEAGGEAKSATYNKARGIFEDTAEEVIGGVTIPHWAINKALWQTNPGDTADALVDFYEDKYADSEDDPTATALAKVKHTVNSVSADLLKEVEATSTLDTGEEVTWHMMWGDSINVDQRVETAQQVLDSKGFSERDQDDYRKMMAGQKRGPKKSGSDRMQAFNKVAVEDAGASGHRGVYRPFGAEVDTLRAVREPLLKTLRRMYGDTITVYRGEESFSDIGEYKEVNGKEVIDFDSHQPAESWSLRPMVARNFGGHILKAEVPIDRVISTTMTGAGYDKEAEVLVAMDRQQRWEYGDNLFTYDADDVPKSRSDAEREEYYDDDRLSPRELFAAELRFAKHHMMLTQPGIELAEWVKYRGPQGGEGWQNVETGEVTYGEKPGDVDESQEQQTLPGAKIDTSERFTRDDVWNSPVAISNIIREVSGNEDLDSLPEFYQWVQEEGTEADIREVHDRLATGSTPYDVTDDDVPDAKFNPNNYEEFGGLSEMLGGDMHGVNAGNMYIAEDGGKRLFITNLNREITAYPEGGAMSPESLYFDREVKADNAYVASKLMGIMNETAPDHHLQENEYLAVEEYDGAPLSPLMSTMRKIRIQDTLFAYGAHLGANAVIGNNDPHGKNVFLGYDGYATVDLDQAFSVKYPSLVIDNVARKMENQMEELFGYQPTEEEEDMILNTAEAMTNAMSSKARYIEEWLKAGEEKNGISPDDLSKRQRQRLNKYIEYIRSGKHKDKIKERLE